MMIDFEDKQPAAPLSILAKIEIALIGGVTLLGYSGLARTVWSGLTALFT